MNRSTPPCPHYARRQCAGCTQLHEPYPAQLAAKEAYVRARLGVPVLPIVPSPLPLGYRISAKLCLHEDREGKRAVGFYKPGTKDVVSVPSCPAQDGAVNRLAAALFGRDVRPRCPVRFYNHQGRVYQRGRLKFAVIRTGPSGARAVILAHTGADRAALTKWFTQLGLADLCVYDTRLMPHDGDAVTGTYIDHLCGPPTMPFALGDARFDLAPGAFFQANLSLAPALVAAATSFQSLPGDVLLDLYGGFGAYSVAVAPRFQKAIVVDGNKAAIDAARRSGLEAHAAYVEPFIDEALARDVAARVTHVIVNPPRGGLSRKVAQLLSTERFPALRELHYVSCNPDTLARDLGVLTTQGLKLRDARPFDMFPQTDHVETVSRLFT